MNQELTIELKYFKAAQVVIGKGEQRFDFIRIIGGEQPRFIASSGFCLFEAPITCEKTNDFDIELHGTWNAQILKIFKGETAIRMELNTDTHEVVFSSSISRLPATIQEKHRLDHIIPAANAATHEPAQFDHDLLANIQEVVAILDPEPKSRYGRKRNYIHIHYNGHSNTLVTAKILPDFRAVVMPIEEAD